MTSVIDSISSLTSHRVIESSSNLLSLTDCEWILRASDDRLTAALVQQHGLPEVLARILAARGARSEDVEHFLNPSLKHLLPDPFHLKDMDIAAARVAKAVINKETIAIFGDYDVDGATSSALLMQYFRALGSNSIVYIPDRMSEGYGPNAKAMLTLKERGASVVITVDCGTLAFEALDAAHAAGLDVIVIDHHQGEARLPKAHAVVNPNRLDETSEHRHLAAVGVAFLLAVAVNKKLREQVIAVPDLRQWLDIVALGTVCDVVSLTGVNRAFVAQGLKVMAARENVGIRTLLDLTGVAEKPSVYHAGFVIGPRINAGGRVGRSDLGVRLLTCSDEQEAKQLAAELDKHNAERKAIESLVQEEAMQMAEAQASEPLIIVSGKSWHPGVIGIVAGRIKERFNRPVAVVACAEGLGKASARSVSGFDMGATVIAARDAGLLVAGGGHAMAAGFTVEESKMPELRAFLLARAMTKHAELTRHKRLHLDAELALAGVTEDLVEKMERLGPFGQGNPSIRVVVRGVVNMKPELVGESHIRTFLKDKLGKGSVSAIAFRAVDTKLGEALFATRGKLVDIACQMKMNEWMGRRSVNLTIEDIAYAGEAL